MIRCKFLLLSMLCSLFFMQSCVHGDLDDCPPMVRYAVAFDYTNHTGSKDRFYDDVKKINLYVFDESGLIYTTVTELSPYETNFNIPLDLPMGNYDIIAWGNVLDNGDFNFPKAITKGTSFNETRLFLQRQANNMIDEELEKLFFGVLNRVEIPLYVSRIDTMSIINNTNNVRVVIHWDHTGELRATENVINYNEVIVRLKASNAEYGFDNRFVSTDNVVYYPWESFYSDSILNVGNKVWETMYYYSDNFSKVTNSCVYDFSILRMALGSPITLTVERKKPAVTDPYNLLVDGSIDVIQTFTTYFDTKNIAVSQMQNMFDKNEYYRIDIFLTYDELMDTYVSGTIHTVPWKLVDQGEVPMN